MENAVRGASAATAAPLSSTPASRAARRPAAALHRFAVFTAACTLLLLVAGGLVTSNDAGLAVPDWPLSYGTWMPPMVGGILYEHGHRMVATFVGLLTIVLAVWLWRRDPRPWMRRLGWAALGLVIVQGLFGGITVLLQLPPGVSIAHATMAQLFFSTTVAIALFTSPWWRAEHSAVADDASPRLRTVAALTVAAIFLQLMLGAAYRHNLLGIVPHLIGAALVVTLASRSSQVVRKRFAAVAALRRLGRLLSAAVGVQIALGLAAWWAVLSTADAPQPMPVMVWLTVAHLAVGALVLAVAVLLLLCAHRVTVPATRTVLAGEAAR